MATVEGFTRDGPDTSLKAIAVQAGVGIGTQTPLPPGGGEGVEGDLVSHLSRLVQSALLRPLEIERGVEVGAEVFLEDTVRDHVCSSATTALIGPRRHAIRRYFAAR
jgi:hypothetical protein